MRIGWIGFHLEGIAALRSLLQDGRRIECVITLDEEGLKKRSASADYEGLCAEYGVPVRRVRSINDAETVRFLRELSLDIVFVIGWSQIVGREALEAARVGMIGAHASLLPHNRGSAPVNWAIIRGEARTGNSLIWLSEGLDDGDIIDQVEFPVSVYDTCSTVFERVAESNLVMIRRVLPLLLKGERPGRPQSRSDEPALPRRRPKDGAIDWNQDSVKVYDFVRALARPYPGAFSRLLGRQCFVWNCAVLPGEQCSGLRPGTVIGPVYSPEAAACGQMVACGRGAVILLELEGEDGAVLKGRELSDQLWKGEIWCDERNE
jgi:methionyl-tRNA formyltransferase